MADQSHKHPGQLRNPKASKAARSVAALTLSKRAKVKAAAKTASKRSPLVRKSRLRPYDIVKATEFDWITEDA